ncbi:class I SAM-dependent methyltransferase [Blastococcus sp. MG754426]|uniref:class I SAM-dependent methyltransferase n=1 Tax=unclassified Blastococcus TaxID=2619396 RepID=UPI001EF002F2|nr:MULTISPECIES: class I SAM-dependent methyltransferase [unclassified Blastococcus]MCF6509076.1 class I SAM-dependent methyltransferase [Blastococcus sp. MG754426]MCF6513694.1 class I SAM-dependent methyltransferase [Blastococcus sp. MG754427]MCF6734228.1 class I SAM-dependent methyltransferase [Blastococcus sp. KM273129]
MGDPGMLMNRIETALVNSGPRRALQRWYETPALLRLGGRLPPKARVVELGCGAGYGTELVLEQFGADNVDAVDLDPQMVERARRRLTGYGDRVRLVTGDVTDLRQALGAVDSSYDAVFEFGILHHVEDWRAAVGEVARVLRPGGRFYFDEVTADALATRGYRWLFDHPTHDRFTAAEFIAELERQGLVVGQRWLTRIRGHYLLGVGDRPAPPLG